MIRRNPLRTLHNLAEDARPYFAGFSHRRADIAIGILICIVAPLSAVALKEFLL